jgi:hypothetical protein
MKNPALQGTFHLGRQLLRSETSALINSAYVIEVFLSSAVGTKFSFTSPDQRLC